MPVQAESVTVYWDEQTTVNLLETELITDGAEQHVYEWKSTRNGSAVRSKVDVIKIDLQNPNVKLDVMTGQNGIYTTKKNTVQNMVNETSAVAGVNADYFDMGSNFEGGPIGAEISDGELISSPTPLSGLYTFAVTNEGKPVIDMYTFNGQLTHEGDTSYRIGGVNKSYSYTQNMLYMYTDKWGGTARKKDADNLPTEMIVIDGIVQQIFVEEPVEMSVPNGAVFFQAYDNAATFIQEHIQVGDAVEMDYEFISSTSQEKLDPENIQMMIGGHTILVDQGKKATYSFSISSISPNSARSRTGIGYSEDERYVYLITVNNTQGNTGLTVSEFQYFMTQIGVWKGINLDGGGSTQMVSRELGEFDPALVAKPEGSSVRRVVNGVGVYSEAPEGALAGFKLSGKETLFINEQTTYELKAYDEYYNPLDVDAVYPVYTDSEELGTWNNNTFTAATGGNTIVQVQSGDVTEQLEIEIISSAQISEMAIHDSILVLEEGQSYPLTLKAVTTSETSVTVPSDMIEWSVEGFEGVVEDGKLKVTSLEGVSEAKVMANFDGLTAEQILPIEQEKTILDFDQKQSTADITTKVYPDDVTGTAALNKMDAAQGQVLSIAYTFSDTAETQAVYASFNEDEGLLTPETPLELDLNVYGNNSNHMLRAIFMDNEGNEQRVTLAETIDWEGWENISADLSSYADLGPLTLQRIYVVKGKETTEEVWEGKVFVDDVRMTFASKVSSRPVVKLVIDQTVMTIGGQEKVLDQAPIIDSGWNTLVPISFIIEAFGGEVDWNNDDRKVTIDIDGHTLEMWIDNPEMVFDGQGITSPLAPQIINERTMIPLRFIFSDTLGWDVGWDDATRTITLR